MKTLGKSTISTSAVVSVATLSLLLANAIPAVAANLTLNSVTGSWTNPIGGGGTVNGVGTNEIRWGTPALFASEQSGFKFDGAAPPSASISTENNFLLGTFTHFNFPVNGGANAVDLDVSLNIGSIQNFKYTFNIQETSNGLFLSSCPSFQISNTPCDDRITFGSGFTDRTFFIDEEEYTLQLAGFSSTADSLNPISSLVTEERRASTAFLFGRITTPVNNEPGTPVS
ncbi:THxN family PEP-CTERM protein, partial [Nodularia sphaerocarpa]